MPENKENSVESLASLAHKLSPVEFMVTISECIDKILGGKASPIIMKTLDIVYEMDENAIVSKPEIFEKAMRMILGDSAGDIVLCSIIDELKVKIRNNCDYYC